jgi:hypothetical protein
VIEEKLKIEKEVAAERLVCSRRGSFGCRTTVRHRGSSLDASAPRLLARQYAIPGGLWDIALQRLKIAECKMAEVRRSRG